MVFGEKNRAHTSSVIYQPMCTKNAEQKSKLTEKNRPPNYFCYVGWILLAVNLDVVFQYYLYVSNKQMPKSWHHFYYMYEKRGKIQMSLRFCNNFS